MPIQTIDTESLNEFWKTISPIGEIAGNMHSPIFRGQADSSWNLYPSLFRPDFYHFYEKMKLDPQETKIWVELTYLKEYVTQLDQAGLTVPNDGIGLRQIINQTCFRNDEPFIWPPQELIPLMANAQHHGIPTRLLDFTRNPFVAAYFASLELLNDQPSEEKRLEVWILDELELNKESLITITAPGSSSKNLAAQQGLFLLLQEQSNLPHTSLNEKKRIVDYLKTNNKITAYQVTLNCKHAKKTIRRCKKFGITANTLFPGYDGAARAVLEHRKSRE